jgi:flavin-dependent dehydrogenase
LARPHIREVLGPSARPEAAHKAWPIPARIDDVRLSGGGGRVLFVGDAARATDPMTGEGIGQALETGMAAAEAIVAAGSDRPALAASSYEDVVRRSLVVDHKLAALLSRALRHRKGARFAVRLAGSSDWTRRNFGRWLFEDYPRAMLATPGRWLRGMLTGPGAYRS